MIVGGSAYPASAAFLTEKPNPAFDEFKMGAIGKTAIYAEEPDKKKDVYLNNLKEFTGGGTLTAPPAHRRLRRPALRHRATSRRRGPRRGPGRGGGGQGRAG